MKRTVAGVVVFFACFALLNQGGALAYLGAVGAWAVTIWLVYFVWPADDRGDVWLGDDLVDEQLAERIRRSVSHLGDGR